MARGSSNGREKYFTSSLLKGFFETVDATIIIDFVKDINIYHLTIVFLVFFLFFISYWSFVLT